MRRFVGASLLDQAAVEDVSQDAMISIADSIGSYTGRGKVTTWVHTIVKHRVVDHLNRQRATVHHALVALPYLYRQPVVLRDIEDHTYADIAQRLNRAEGTVKVQIVYSYQVPSISVGSANVESVYLSSYRDKDADHPEYIGDDQATSYTAEGDVLFDSDDHALGSGAEADLATLADDIALRDDEYIITVKDHTDDLPAQQYDNNVDLSEHRSESAVAWL